MKELTTKISETRMSVSSVKATIDGMRGTRDTQMNEMHALKAKLKEQNNRLLMLSQEKARLEIKNKQNQAQDEDNKEALAQAASAKQIALKQLRDRIADLEKEVCIFLSLSFFFKLLFHFDYYVSSCLHIQVESKMDDMQNNNSQLGDLKTELSTLVSECETLYNTYDERRTKVRLCKSIDLSYKVVHKIESQILISAPLPFYVILLFCFVF